VGMGGTSLLIWAIAVCILKCPCNSIEVNFHLPIRRRRMLRFPPTLRTHLLLAVVFVSILTVVQPRPEAFPNCPGGCFRGFWLGFPVVEGGGGINGFILDIPPYSERHFVGSSTVGTQFGAFDFEFAGTNAESGRVNIVGSGRHGMIQIFGDFTEGV